MCLSKAMESLVIQTRTARCGKCYKIDLDGVFRGNSYCDEEIVKEFNAYSGNCVLIPRNTVEDQLTRMVKKCWEETLIIVQLLASNIENIVSVNGHQWLQNAKNKNKKWIVVKTKKSVYWLVFDRMYMEEDKEGQIINTIYGLIQFYRDIDTSHKPEGPNSIVRSATRYRYKTWNMYYPITYKDSENMEMWIVNNDISENNTEKGSDTINRARAYNPTLSICNAPIDIARTFVKFILI